MTRFDFTTEAENEAKPKALKTLSFASLGLRGEFRRVSAATILATLLAGCVPPHEIRSRLRSREIGGDILYESAPERWKHPNRYYLTIEPTSFGPFPCVLLDPRLRVELEENRDVSASTPDTRSRALLRTRILIDSGLYYKHVNYRVELQDSREAFVGPAKTEQNRVDVRQGYVFLGNDRTLWGLKLGRVELDLGRGSLIGADWNDNLDRSFDGTYLTLADGWYRFDPRTWTWRLDLFLGRPVRQVDGPVDLDHDDPGVACAYYSDRRSDPVRFDAGIVLTRTRRDDFAGELGGTGRETLATLSGAASADGLGPAEGLSFEAECALQFGMTGPDRHGAAMLAGHVSYTFPTPWKVRLRGGFELAGGDRDPADGLSGTFRPPFPGDMWEELGLLELIGDMNSFVPSLGISFEPIEGLRLGARLLSLRVIEPSAGWFDGEGEPMLAPVGEELGGELDLFVRYAFFTESDKEVRIEGGYAVFQPGSGLAGAEVAQGLFLQATFRF